MKTKILLLALLFSLCFSCNKTIEKPTVTTSDIKEITQISAVCGGKVSSDGGSEVTSRGICYSITENPTITEGSMIDCGSGTGDFECTISELSINSTYYVRAYATNSEGTSYGKEITFTTYGYHDDYINGYAYIDLGLPSGLKWATHNMGAESFEEVGDSYAWGEIKAGIVDSVTYGIEISDFSGDPRYDAARAAWGSTWRMPTKQEFDELIEYCEYEWIEQDYKFIMKMTGPNGKSIFFPSESQYDGMFYSGSIWSSTPYHNDIYSYLLSYETPMYIHGEPTPDHPSVGCSHRIGERGIRPVSE